MPVVAIVVPRGGETCEGEVIEIGETCEGEVIEMLLKIPRGNINRVGEDEVTVTSGQHAQAERTNKQTEERGLHPVEASTKIRSQVMLLTHARLATEGVLCRKLKCTG